MSLTRSVNGEKIAVSKSEAAGIEADRVAYRAKAKTDNTSPDLVAAIQSLIDGDAQSAQTEINKASAISRVK